MTSNKHQVQAAVGLEVIDVPPGAADQVRIFDAADRGTKNGRRHTDEVYVYPRRAMGHADPSSPALLPHNTWHADGALQGLLAAWLSPQMLGWAAPALVEMGRAAADELARWGDACEQQPAVLRRFDGWGDRVDEVVYPHAWRQIAASAASNGLVALPYETETLARFGAHARVVQAALCYLFAPSTATYLCPVAMTDGAARVLADAGTERQRRDLLAHLVTRDAAEAWTSGQWMTERQGGSDVGLNAVAAKRDGDGWRLFGRKFFCSNIGSEMALALARPEGAPPGTRGLALFVVLRDGPDGRRNRYRIDRLKDKLGTRAMATGEVTLDGAHAELVGEAERGFAQMTAMLNITRLHNAITAAAIMRRAVMVATAYAGQREAFGRKLEEHPLHRAVLAQMAAEADGALYLTLRMAQLLGRIETGAAGAIEVALFRVGIALAKLYTGKQAVAVASETIECFGGQGYMEDTGLPRLLRDAQVLPIWEGTTSVLSLDVLRVLRKPEVLEAVAGELVRLDAPERDCALDLAQKTLGDESATAESAARRLAFTLAQSWMGGLLHQAGNEVRLRGIGLQPR
jgi:alkylation response protein AidB-like acyl-CoA dehydrogenase